MVNLQISLRRLSRFLPRACALLLLFRAIVASAATKVCIQNAIPMDKLSIELGHFAEDPGIDTLFYANLKTISGLVDNDASVLSGYELLVQAPDGVGYVRVVELDPDGGGLLVFFAQSVGICATCYGPGFQEDLRITVVGTVDDGVTLGDSDARPPQMKLSNLALGFYSCPDDAQIVVTSPGTTPVYTSRPSPTPAPTTAAPTPAVTTAATDTPATTPPNATDAPTTPLTPEPTGAPTEGSAATGAPTPVPTAAATMTPTDAPTPAPMDTGVSEPPPTLEPTQASASSSQCPNDYSVWLHTVIIEGDEIKFCEANSDCDGFLMSGKETCCIEPQCVCGPRDEIGCIA